MLNQILFTLKFTLLNIMIILHKYCCYIQLPKYALECTLQ